MGTVKLIPGYLVVQSYTEEESVWPESVYDLAPCFFYSLEIDPAYTLGDLFRLLDRDGTELLETVLHEYVIPLLDEAREPPSNDEEPGVEYLRVYNRFEEGRLIREFDGWGPWTNRTPERGRRIRRCSPLR